MLGRSSDNSSLRRKMSEDPELRYVLNHRRRKLVAAKYAVRHALAFAVVTLLFVVLFLKAQGLPVGEDQALDLFAAAAIAAGAGTCLAGIRLSTKELRRAAKEQPTTDPRLQAIGGQLKFFNWVMLILTIAGFIAFTLLAVSIGCRRPDWAAWIL